MVSSEQRLTPMPQQVFAGVDWGGSFHQLCLVDQPVPVSAMRSRHVNRTHLTRSCSPTRYDSNMNSGGRCTQHLTC